MWCCKYSLVGSTGFEPATPALSRRCSEPTELTPRISAAKVKQLWPVQKMGSYYYSIKTMSLLRAEK